MQGTELFCTNSSAVSTQWGLLDEHHIHGVALAAHFGVTLAEPGVLLPDPMAVTGPSHPFPRPRHGHIHERPLVGQHYLGLHPGPLRLVGAPSLGACCSWDTCCTSTWPGVGTRWLGIPLAPAMGQPWPPAGAGQEGPQAPCRNGWP